MIKNKLNFYKSFIFIYLVLSIVLGINFFLNHNVIFGFGFIFTIVLYVIYIFFYIREKLKNK